MKHKTHILLFLVFLLIRINPFFGQDRKPVVFYLQNLPYERIGTENDVTIVDSLSQNFHVIPVDCSTFPRTSPELEERLTLFHIESPAILSEYYSQNEIESLEIFYVPEGYMLETQIPVWSLKEHGAEGTIQRIMDTYNNEIVNKYGVTPVNNPDEMVDKQGKPIDYNMYMHIIYPSGFSQKKVPLIMNFGTLSPRQIGFNPIKPRLATIYRNIFPLGFLTTGYAWAHVDHCYNPLARDEVWGYFDRYSLEDWNGLSLVTAYVRYVKLKAEQFNLNKKIGVMGISKASYSAIRIANKNNAEGQEHFLFNNTANDKPQPWSGENSQVDVAWAAAGLGTMRVAKYVDFNTVPTITSAGFSDQYGQWPIYPEVVRRFSDLDINHLNFWMEDLGHDYPGMGVDLTTGENRYQLFKKYFDNFLKPSTIGSLKPLYIYPKINAQEVNNSGHSRILPHDGVLPTNMLGVSPYAPITIRFLSEINPLLVEQHVKIVHKTTGQAINGNWTAKTGNTVFEFEPEKKLVYEETYQIILSENLENVHGQKIEEEIVREFTVSIENENNNETNELKILPTNDTYQKVALGTTPYGSAETLRVRFSNFGDWRFDTYLKFTIPDINPDRIMSAKIKLASAGTIQGEPISLTIYKTTTNWTESTLISTNKPTINATALDQYLYTGNDLWSTFDVTSSLKADLHNNDSIVSFVIRAPAGNTEYVYYHSKEAVNEELHPYLEIEEIIDVTNRKPDRKEITLNVLSKDKKLHINGDGLKQVFIFDISGKLLLQNNLLENHNSIDISTFESGVYLVSINLKNTKKTIKIVL